MTGASAVLFQGQDTTIHHALVKAALFIADAARRDRRHPGLPAAVLTTRPEHPSRAPVSGDPSPVNG